MKKKYIIVGVISLAILCGIQIATTHATTCLFSGQGGTGCPVGATIGYNLYVASTTTIGTTTIPLYGYQANGSGGSGSSTTSFYVNGILYTTTSSINFSAGTGVSITTSTINGIPSYTIASTGSGSSTNVYGVSPIVVTQSGVNATTSCPTCLTTSTFNATGTAWYVTGWNGSGTALLASTSIYISSSTGNIGIGTQTATAPLSIGTIGTSGNVPVMDIYNYAGNLSGEFMISPQSATSSLLYVNFPSTSNAAGGNWLAYRFGASTNKWFFGDDGTNAYFQTVHPMFFSAGVSQEGITNTPQLEINTNGNITIAQNLNASGTITQAGVPVCTTTTCVVSGVATTTINGTQATVFRLIGDNSTISSTLSGATTTFFVIPGTYLTPASGTALFYPLSSNPAGYITTSTNNFGGMTTASATALFVTGQGSGVSGDCAKWNSSSSITDAGAPCGSGGGGSGGVASSSPVSSGTLPLFLANGNITNSTVTQSGNTLTFGGTQSSTISGNAVASSYILYDNNEEYLNPGFQTIGAAGSSTATTFQAAINAIAQQAQANGQPGITIHVNFSVTSTAWTAPLTLNQNGFIVSIQCSAGVVLGYSGTGTALDFNNGNPSGHLASDDHGCIYQGHTSLIVAGQTNTATTTGIMFGGNQGAVGIYFWGNSINGFGTDLTVATNSYMVDIEGNSISGGNGGQSGEVASEIQVDKASNSGEGIDIDKNHITDPGNSSSTNCIVFQDGSVSNGALSGNQIDDCQVYNGYSNGLLTIDDGNHFEDSDFAAYMPYIYIYGTSSQASYMSITGNIFEVDDTNSATIPAEIILHGQQVYAAGNVLENYGGQTIPLFMQHNLNNGTESEMVCQLQAIGGTLTNIVDNQAYSQAAGATCIEDVGNSYPYSAYIDSGNTVHFRNGNGDVATVTNNGAWTFSNNGTPGSVKVTGTLNTSGNTTLGGTLNVTSTATFQATSTFLGNVSTTVSSALVSANSSGILGAYAGSSCVNQGVSAISATGTVTCTTFATSTASSNNATGTTGYAAYFTGANTLGSSTLYGSSTFAIGTTTLYSAYSLNAVGSQSAANGGTIVGVQNTVSSSYSGFAATADNGASTTNYGFFGINNSNGAEGAEKAGDTVIEASDTTGGIDIATNTSTIRLFVGGTYTGTTATNTQLTVASGSVTVGNGTSSLVWVGNNTGGGYWDATGTLPTLSSCGTSPTSTGNIDRFRVVVGSGVVTSCTVTFPIAFKNIPSCLIEGESSLSGLAWTPGTSTVIFTATSLSSDIVDGSCEGQGE